jgi:hypothetical protein
MPSGGVEEEGGLACLATAELLVEAGFMGGRGRAVLTLGPRIVPLVTGLPALIKLYSSWPQRTLLALACLSEWSMVFGAIHV